MLTDRDGALLRHLAAARWLSTRQAAALSFPGVSHSMVCRRLRLMRRAGFIRTVRENSMMEGLHTLAARGREALKESGWERPIMLERQPPAHRRHFLGVNDIRIAVLTSAARDGVRLEFFFANWELTPHNWPYGIYPDAVCAASDGERSATALFEYDRATEGAAYLVERKLKRYAEGLEGFPFSQVVTVVENERRLRRLTRYAEQRLADPRFVFMLRDALAVWNLRDFVAATRSRGGSDGRSGGGTVSVRQVLISV